MANWKKVIVSGSQAHLAGITGSTLTDERIAFVTSSGALTTDDILQYRDSGPNESGMVLSGSIFSGSFVGDGSGLTGLVTTLQLSSSNDNTTSSIDLKTDGLTFSGSNGINITVSSSNVAIAFSESLDSLVLRTLRVTERTELSGSTFVSGNLDLTGSVYYNDIRFATGAAAYGQVQSIDSNGNFEWRNPLFGSGSTVKYAQEPAAVSWSFYHHLGEKYPVIQVYDSDSHQIIPHEIQAVDDGLAYIIFPSGSPQSGTAVATAGGVAGYIAEANYAKTSSYSVDFKIEDTFRSANGKTEVTGALYVSGATDIEGELVARADRWDVTGVDVISGSIFSGSFVGDGSGLTGLVTDLSFSSSNTTSGSTIDLKAQDLIFSGSNGIEINVSGNTVNLNLSQSLTDLEINTLRVLRRTELSGSTNVSGTLDIEGTTYITGSTSFYGQQIISGSTELAGEFRGTGFRWDFTKVDVISGSVFSGSFVGDGSGLTGIVTDLVISSSNGTGSINLKEESLLVSGTLNEVEVSFSDASNLLRIGLPDDVVITNDLTVGGDLFVNGDTTQINTQNLLIEDRWAMLASGSTTRVDGGIIVQSDAANTGYAFGIDSSVNRWALQKDLGDGVNDMVADSYMTTTQFGLDVARPVTPEYGGVANGFGNIWVSTDTEEIFIFS